MSHWGGWDRPRTHAEDLPPSSKGCTNRPPRSHPWPRAGAGRVDTRSQTSPRCCSWKLPYGRTSCAKCFCTAGPDRTVPGWNPATAGSDDQTRFPVGAQQTPGGLGEGAGARPRGPEGQRGAGEGLGRASVRGRLPWLAGWEQSQTPPCAGSPHQETPGLREQSCRPKK